MPEIIAAYARGNLHALLQLELQWLCGPSGDATRLSLDKLRASTELLKQQATELADEVQSLQLHPRYAPSSSTDRSAFRWSSTGRVK
jgi:hypothetical protein